ncbi:MAG: AAA family ATPase [Rhodospirillaceae bacterium]|nr:AAA family ATPase [Rhodospirillaceae bacterium]
MTIYLDAVRPRAPFAEDAAFPFSLPLVREMGELRFRAPATFFVGENGSGKSTLLEAIACGMKAVAIGSAALERDPTLAPARALGAALRFARRRAPKRKAFLRAEDVFGFTKRVAAEMDDLGEMEDHFRGTMRDGSWGQKLAMGVARGQKGALAARYGDDPDAGSHGETFLRVMTERIRPGGLYFLDEPETPLSPQRQLALLALLKERVGEDCQFVIATHSPILMALPEAEIWLFDNGAIRTVAWDDVEHVSLTRSFLANPQRFLDRL